MSEIVRYRGTEIECTFSEQKRAKLQRVVEALQQQEAAMIRQFLTVGKRVRLNPKDPEIKKNAQSVVRNLLYREICQEITRMLSVTLTDRELLSLCTDQEMTYDTIIEKVETFLNNRRTTSLSFSDKQQQEA